MDFSLENLSIIWNNFILRIKRFQFNNKVQLAFLEDLYSLVGDGIPPNRAIEMMTEVTKGISREAAVTISQKIAEGQPLAEGMRDWFAPNIVEIIRVGEEGGAVAETLQSSIKTLSQRSSSLTTLISAITYPIVVIIAACVIIVYINHTVFVQFNDIKPMAKWPQAGRDLVNIANIIQGWWWLVLIIIASIVLGIRYMMNNYVGELRPIIDKFFPFSLYRRFAASRFLETLGLLVANGIVFKHALRVMQYQANPYVGSHLLMMEHLLGMGRGNIADVLSTGLVNESDILRLRIMAEVKGFEHGLVRMGVRGSEQNTKNLKFIARLFGGTLLAVGALLIMVIVRGIYLTGMSMGTV